MPDLVARIVGALVVAYLVGGIPWALIIGRLFYKVDPREHGSGNLGATNVFRVLGARAGIATLLLDALKGATAVAITMAIVPATPDVLVYEWARVGAMMFAVLGHSFSPYIRFQGGKGVATSAGALFVLTPLAALIELTIFVAVVAGFRMVSLGSVVAALIYPFLALWLYPDDLPLIITIFVLAALVIWRHRSNIGRIARGEERKVSLSARGEALKTKEGQE